MSVLGNIITAKYASAYKGSPITIENPDPVNEDGSQDISPLDYYPMNTLVIISQTPTSDSDLMFLMNYDPLNSKMNFLFIPQDIKIIVNNEIIPIKSLNLKVGPTETIKYISNKFNIGVRYYLNLDYNTFKSAIDVFDGVEFNLPVDIKYSIDNKSFNVDLQKGQQTFDGAKALQLFKFYQTPDGVYNKELFQYYDGKCLKRIEMQQKFIKEFCLQKFRGDYLNRISEKFKMILSTSQTNISVPTDLDLLCYDIKKLEPEQINFFILSTVQSESSNYLFEYTNKIKNMSNNNESAENEIFNIYFKSMSAK